jgi:hypothetical protein
MSLMIYCPQCGSGMPETTKYCRNCGLPLAQLTGYVATGGTAPIAPPPTQPTERRFQENMTPGQRLFLTIMLMIFSIPVFGILAGFGGPFHIFGYLAGLAAVLLPVGITLAVIDYKNRVRRLSPPMPFAPQQFQTPPAPPQFQPTYQPPAPQPHPQPLPSDQTNPLAEAPPRGSVIEDETRRLPEERR